MSFPSLHSLVAEKARSLGFVAVGFTEPVRAPCFDRFRAWLDAKKNGDMAWLGKHLDVRENPSRMLKGCRTIISLAYPYPPRQPQTEDGFFVARYANPVLVDYHTRMRSLCSELVSLIKANDPASRNRVCVDSAPIVERTFAAVAGVGFIGKNNLLIVPGYGSYVYLAEILTTAAMVFPFPRPVPCACGSCSLCLEACPTGALERAFSIDAAKCLSYLTVEYQGKLEAGLGTALGKCFFGCDRCQEVCPFNRQSDASEVLLPSTDVLLGMDAEAFERDFGRTAFARTGLEKLKENIYAARKRPLNPI